MTTADKQLLDTSRFQVVEVERVLADGTVFRRAVIRHAGAVTIIPFVDDDRVCLIRNYRMSVDQALIELPAGTIERPEPPIETAHRELIEETGFRAGKLEPLHSFYLSPGILDERMHLFVARDLTDGEPARELGEEIHNLIVPWQEAIRMIKRGEIQDAKSIAGLLYYHNFHRS